MNTTMSSHKIVPREEWLAARAAPYIEIDPVGPEPL